MFNLISSIDPVAFHIFGIPIRWYAIFITSALIVCLVWGSIEAERRGVSSDFILEIFICCVPVAIIFARVFYVLAHPESYFPVRDFEDFKHLYSINEGGLTIIGGIFGAVLAAFVLSRIRKKNLLEMMDFGMPFMLLGQALGRWGNYVNQEAYGKVVTSEFFKQFPLGVYIDYTSKWHYATFFYEMVLNIIGFVVLFIVSRKSNKRGVVALLYFVWYGIVRGLMEFIREDAVIVNGVYITQVGSFVAAAIGIIIVALIISGKLSFGISNKLLPIDRLSPTQNIEMEIERKEFIAIQPQGADKPQEPVKKVKKEKKKTTDKP